MNKKDKILKSRQKLRMKIKIIMLKSMRTIVN